MNEPIKSIEEFISWTKQLEGGFLLFRGLADTTWEVSASAYRRIKTLPDEAPSPSVFQNYIKRLLDDVSLRGFREQQGKRYSDLELLAELQHNGAATCLIDFTTNSLIALWFACQEKPGQTGKVVAMPTDNIELFSIVSYQDLENPIEEFLHKNNKLWKWTPSHLSNRIVTQQSVFVFGQGKIEQAHYEEVKIDGVSKEEIRNELQERFGITEQHLFSDFTGFALSNAPYKPYTGYTADIHLNSGIEFHQKRELEKAIDAYDQAIRCNPRHAGAYYSRGIAKHELGDHQGAIADYDKAIEINPQHAYPYNNRGHVKHELGDHQDAIADYDKAIEIDPQHVYAYNNRGIAKSALGDHHRAIADYDIAIKFDPKFAGAYNNRGHAKHHSGDYTGAILDYHEAILLNPRDAEAYCSLGDCKRRLGKSRDAIADYDKAIEFDPKFTGAYNNRGNAKHELGDHQRAITDYDKAIEINPQYAEAYYNRGLAKYQLKDYQGAISDYDKVIELNPQYPGAYHNRGIAKQGSGDEAGAKEDAAKADELVEIQNRQLPEP